MFDSKPIVQRLKSYRKEHDITQGELAKRLGVSGPTLSRWENNRADFNPTLKQLLSMADMFGVTLIELFSQGSDTVSTPVEDGVEKAKKTSKRTQKTPKAKTSAKAKAATVLSSEEKKTPKRTVKTSSAAAVKGTKVKKSGSTKKAVKKSRKTPVKVAKASIGSTSAVPDKQETAKRKPGRPRKQPKA